ncbi:hypothetical protein ACLG6S_11530 [Thermodesulfobacteriota bacterium B35]
MNNILLITWITYKDTIRNRALHGIFLSSIFLFICNALVTEIFTWELGKVAVDVSLSIISLTGLLFIFFLAINNMARDITEKKLYLILSKPIERSQYILGKYFGFTLVLLLSSTLIGIASAITVKLIFLAYPAYQAPNFSWATYLISLIFLAISLQITLSFSLFWITVTTHPYMAMLFSLTTYFIGNSLETTKLILTNEDIFRQNTMLLWLMKSVSWIFPNLKSFDLKITAAHGLGINWLHLLLLGGYGTSYIALILFFSVLVFNRRELG